MKTVSVQIVTYNSEQHMPACLDALLEQTYQPVQIVIIDNASQDQTVEVVNEFKVRHADANIQLVLSEENVGFAAAHNQALQMTTSDYVLVLNPDVTLEAHYIERLVACLEERIDVGSCTGKLLSSSDPQLIDSTGLIMTKARRAFDRGAGEQASDWGASHEVFGVSGAAVMYDRQLIDDVSVAGLFYDEVFFAYKEDVDVAWRAQLLGWRAYYVADAVAYHGRGWKQGGRQCIPLSIRRHSYINRYMMMIKNDSVPHMLRHSLYILAYELLSLGYFVVREPRVLGAWVYFWREFGKLLKQRKWIMSRRKVAFKAVYRWFHSWRRERMIAAARNDEI